MGWLPRSNIKKDAAPDLLKGPAGWCFSGLNWFDDTPTHHIIGTQLAQLCTLLFEVLDDQVGS